jgi:hypothetical protein
MDRRTFILNSLAALTPRFKQAVTLDASLFGAHAAIRRSGKFRTV